MSSSAPSRLVFVYCSLYSIFFPNSSVHTIALAWRMNMYVGLLPETIVWYLVPTYMLETQLSKECISIQAGKDTQTGDGLLPETIV